MTQIFSARVRAGTIVPDDGVTLPEGATVTIIADDDTQPFEVTADEESELLEATAEVDKPDQPVQAKVEGMVVEVRVVPQFPEGRSAADVFAAIGPWEGETTKEIMAFPSEARREGARSAS